MEKKTLLSFPNCKSISLKLLSKITVELQGYCYTSQRLENEDGGVIIYYPKSCTFLSYNSFLPIITVEKAASSSGVVLCLIGKLTKSVRAALAFFYTSYGLLQCFLIKSYLDGSLDTPFVGFIPVIMFAFLFVLSTVTKSLAIKAFAVKYRTQIEELISMESTT